MCRPIIGLDWCHIKGHHTGQLLSAVGVDANNGMFPIAFAVVESEGKATWTWFLKWLQIDLSIENGYHWTFITDKQKGLKEALTGIWEEGSVMAEHRHCARHLQSNFTKVYLIISSDLKTLYCVYVILKCRLYILFVIGVQGSVFEDKDDGSGYGLLSRQI